MGLIITAILSLGIVILIMYVLLKIIQRYTKIGYHNLNNLGNHSLRLENIIYVDNATKIVTIGSQNGTRYIVAISKENMLLLDKINNRPTPPEQILE